ncbi:CAunnamed protein product [Biomphalaria glabrata]|nr:CAunnamed protein product [Biomphalaria glabrata]
MSVMQMATWNVRTMFPDLANDPQLADDARTRKTAVITNELKRLNMYIAAYKKHETGKGNHKMRLDYMVWTLSVKNSLFPMIVPPVDGLEHLINTSMMRTSEKFYLFSFYAPIQCSL